MPSLQLDIYLRYIAPTSLLVASMVGTLLMISAAAFALSLQQTIKRVSCKRLVVDEIVSVPIATAYLSRL